MDKKTWDNIIEAALEKITSRLRAESENQRELYGMKLRMRANNGQVKKKFSFPIGLNITISNEDANDYDVTVKVKGGATRESSETTTVHASGTDFLDGEGKAAITNATKGDPPKPPKKSAPKKAGASAGK